MYQAKNSDLLNLYQGLMTQMSAMRGTVANTEQTIAAISGHYVADSSTGFQRAMNEWIGEYNNGIRAVNQLHDNLQSAAHDLDAGEAEALAQSANWQGPVDEISDYQSIDDRQETEEERILAGN
jgi:uncharacterized protein YukE